MIIKIRHWRKGEPLIEPLEHEDYGLIASHIRRGSRFHNKLRYVLNVKGY